MPRKKGTRKTPVKEKQTPRKDNKEDDVDSSPKKPDADNNTTTTIDKTETAQVVPDTPDATHKKLEDTPTKRLRSARKKSPKVETEAQTNSLPPEYAHMKKALLDLALSIKNSTKANVLANKYVEKNFKDLSQIFEGLTTPQKEPTTPTKTSGGKNKKRKQSELKDENDELSAQMLKHVKISDEVEVKDIKIKTIEEKAERLSKELTEERSAHQQTQTQKERLEKSSEKFNSIIKKNQEELQKKEEEVEKKNEELKNMKQKTKETTEKQEADTAVLIDQLNEAKREMEKLKEGLRERTAELEQKNTELKKKDEEINELRNRVSSLSASKLEGDPNITDLGDPNRPLKLVEKYQLLYDNSWTDAFDELTDSHTDIDDNKLREKKAAEEILTIFKEVLQFCQQTVKHQEQTVKSTLMCCSDDQLDQTNDHIDLTAIRNIRKSTAQQIIPFVQKTYFKQNTQELTDSLKTFIEECIAMCWLTQVQDPPMAFEYDYVQNSQFDKDLMREFTVSGDQLDYVVWPTLRLKKDGPVMVKSVVQPLKKKR